jgi:hypothetical protein
VSRLALLVGMSIMELGWVYPWSLLLGTWIAPSQPRTLLSPASVLGLVLVAGLTTHFIVRRIGTRRAAQTLLISLGIVGVLLAVRFDQFPSTGGGNWLEDLVRALAVVLGQPTAPALAVGLGLLLWWRGVGIGSSTLTFYDAEGTFRWGTGALVVAGAAMAIGTTATTRPVLEAQAAPFVVGFFFVSLLTLALGRLESLRSRTRALGLNTQWLGVLIAVAGMLVLSALVVAQILSFDVLVLATRPLFDLIGFLLLVLVLLFVIPLAYVVEMLVYLLMQLIRPDPNATPPEPRQPSEFEEMLRRLFGEGLAPEVIDAARALGVAVLLGVGLLLVARTVARWRPPSALADSADEERETLWEPERVRKALLAWLRRLFDRRRRLEPGRAASAPALESSANATRERSVRELYRRLLRLGSAAGASRPLPTTPFEHLPALEHALEPTDDLGQLTDAYVLVRYAERTPPSSEVELLEQRLDRIQNRPTVEPDSDSDA